jgi:hypothetical protein
MQMVLYYRRQQHPLHRFHQRNLLARWWGGGCHLQRLFELVSKFRLIWIEPHRCAVGLHCTKELLIARLIPFSIETVTKLSLAPRLLAPPRLPVSLKITTTGKSETGNMLLHTTEDTVHLTRFRPYFGPLKHKTASEI